MYTWLVPHCHSQDISETGKSKKGRKSTRYSKVGVGLGVHAGRLQVDDLEGVAVLDDDVVHVDGLEAGEVLGEGDEVDGGALVELEEVGFLVVALPPQSQQLPLQRRVGGDHLVGGRVQQRLSSNGRRLLVSRVLHQPHHPILEHPNPSHNTGRERERERER
ncbi:unnamed protein product, partial [Musa acuminata var. zebrina]